MQAATLGTITAAVSAIAGAASAMIAAFSSWNSWRSARASQAALNETRRQWHRDNVRQELQRLGTVYDHAMALAQALTIDLRRDPATVERHREALRRCLLVAGLTTDPALTHLADADRALTLTEMAAVRAALTARSAALHGMIMPATQQRLSGI